MEILKTLNGDELVMALVGRLDSATSPDLDAAVKASIDGIKSLVFDFEKLDYVSSAGLRVLLATQKTMNAQGKMVIRHVCPEIMDVFEMTGFTDLLNIE